AVLPDAQGQAVLPQRPLGRIVIGGFEMLARALVARIRRYDRGVVETGEMIGIDQELELDFDAFGLRRRCGGRCRFALLRLGRRNFAGIGWLLWDGLGWCRSGGRRRRFVALLVTFLGMKGEVAGR